MNVTVTLTDSEARALADTEVAGSDTVREALTDRAYAVAASLSKRMASALRLSASASGPVADRGTAEALVRRGLVEARYPTSYEGKPELYPTAFGREVAAELEEMRRR